MMPKAWSSIEEVPYCFSRSSVKFQGHIALKNVEFDQNWAFQDCNSSLNSPMAMKCCTKFETAKKRCPIVFQGHPSNFKVTRDKTSPILTQIGRFRTIGRSQLSNPSDLPCLYSSPSGQKGRHFADDIVRSIFVNEKFCILIKNFTKVRSGGSNWQYPSIGLSNGWRRIGDKPLSQPMLIRFTAAIWGDELNKTVFNLKISILSNGYWWSYVLSLLITNYHSTHSWPRMKSFARRGLCQQKPLSVSNFGMSGVSF